MQCSTSSTYKGRNQVTSTCSKSEASCIAICLFIRPFQSKFLVQDGLSKQEHLKKHADAFRKSLSLITPRRASKAAKFCCLMFCSPIRHRWWQFQSSCRNNPARMQQVESYQRKAPIRHRWWQFQSSCRNNPARMQQVESYQRKASVNAWPQPFWHKPSLFNGIQAPSAPRSFLQRIWYFYVFFLPAKKYKWNRRINVPRCGKFARIFVCSGVYNKC